MKRAVVALALLAVAASPALAADKDPTGLDWLLMPREQKIVLVGLLMDQMQREGIPLSATQSQYIGAVDVAVDDPKLKSVPVASILETIVYQKEPGSRPALNRLKEQKERLTKRKA